MGKARDLFKKIRDIKGRLHATMDTIKDRNGMDPTEAGDIKKRDITLLTKIHLVKAMVFPVVMYESECWAIKKAEP